MSDASATAVTVLDELLAALDRAAEYNRDDQVAPAVVLWTDKDRHWERLLPLLRSRLPELLSLGALAAGNRAGPAIWLKCVLGRVAADVALPAEAVPVIYLPGVSRAELRAIEECPRLLQPLAELQYRGVFFSQRNGRDWTVRAFLEASDGGLGLDVAADAATTKAIVIALLPLAASAVEGLRGRRLEAADFHALVTPDAVKDLLEWMSDPEGAHGRWNAERMRAFVETCRTHYHFDAEKDGPLVAAESLGARSRDAAWDMAWRRFAEAPELYPGIRALLDKAEPGPKERTRSLLYREDAWPGACSRAEQELRQGLLALASVGPQTASDRIEELEQKHRHRRAWVWARLGMAPLAKALEPLARLARGTRTSLVGGTAEEMAQTWATGGWRVDADVIDALSAVESGTDVNAVKAAIRSVYLPWVDALASRLQERVSAGALPRSEPLPTSAAGTCILFADGLRLDVGRRLEQALAAMSLEVDLGWRWAGVPTVTATAKPAVSPVASRLAAGPVAEFQTSLDGKAMTTDRFRRLLDAEGITFLQGEAMGDPAARAWTEAGSLDRYGHDQGWKLARRVAEEVRELAGRVRALVEAGWREVRIVTDHGWLLMPDGLPATPLPAYLAESRWGRCAALKEGALADTIRVPWSWDPCVWIALAPGVRTFINGMEYAHGGLSLQESVVPVLTVRPTASPAAAGHIAAVKWTGLRCRVTVEGARPGSCVDLRRKVADASSSIMVSAGPKAVDGDREVTLYASDDCEGEAAFVVLLSSDGAATAKLQTTIGGDGQ